MKNNTVIKSLLNKITRFKRIRFPCRDFCRSGLILHFSYHKCLTVYYNNVFRRLSDEFGFEFAHLSANLDQFNEKVRAARATGVYSIHLPRQFEFAGLPPYKASHLVRNPKDLIVSGYKYHLWTEEAWCVNPSFNWTRFKKDEIFREFVEPDERKFPRDVSYRDYINRLDGDRALYLEMVWRRPTFKVMDEWDYQNPLVKLLRYEDVIGQEKSAFSQLFDHYELRPDIVRRGIEIAEDFSLKNQTKGEQRHTRNGSSGQWKAAFSVEHHQVFDAMYPGLMRRVGYESDLGNIQ